MKAMQRATFVLLFVVSGCSDAKSSPPALLGVRSDIVISQISSRCVGRLSTDSVQGNGFRSEWIDCTLPDNESYRITFDHHDRINEISISAPEKHALAIFDQAIAPIVPETIAATMRISISDPARFDLATKPGPCVDLTTFGAGWQTGGAPRQITWHLDECVGKSR